MGTKPSIQPMARHWCFNIPNKSVAPASGFARVVSPKRQRQKKFRREAINKNMAESTVTGLTHCHGNNSNILTKNKHHRMGSDQKALVAGIKSNT